MSNDDRHQVVGVDGSDGSCAAVTWAAARTDRFGPVHPVTVWDYPNWGPSPGFDPMIVAPDSGFRQAAVDTAERVLDPIDSALRHELTAVRGMTGPALVKAAAGADLLVVGTRGRGAVASGILGSVSLHCVHHATVPVAVVPPNATANDRYERVVVGYDGSSQSRRALDWVLATTPASAAIDVVHAWDPGAATVAAVATLVDERLEAQAQDLVDEVIATIEDEVTQRSGAVTGLVRRGDARSVLRAEAGVSRPARARAAVPSWARPPAPGLRGFGARSRSSSDHGRGPLTTATITGHRPRESGAP